MLFGSVSLRQALIPRWPWPVGFAFATGFRVFAPFFKKEVAYKFLKFTRIFSRLVRHLAASEVVTKGPVDIFEGVGRVLICAVI
jgi:hypothetical protein